MRILEFTEMLVALDNMDPNLAAAYQGQLVALADAMAASLSETLDVERTPVEVTEDGALLVGFGPKGKGDPEPAALSSFRGETHGAWTQIIPTIEGPAPAARPVEITASRAEVALASWTIRPAGATLH